jgi:tetratricopeptide (TPR) repeat protein
MVLGKDFTPVSQLSAAFPAPKTDLHLQFAYFESALVVEFLIKQFGTEALRQILGDLGADVEINQAIAAHTAPMETIEKDFSAFARERAEKLAPGLDFEKPPPRAGEEWFTTHPTNYFTLTRLARRLLADKKFPEAKAALKQLIDLYPSDTDADNAERLLAEAHRSLNETNLEREVLTRLAARDADDLDTFLRLTQLCNDAKDWACVAENAERFLAVNPLLAEPYHYLASASETLGRNSTAIQAYQTMLLLDPPDPADAHFRLARLLHQAGDAGAKRHVLQALEEAPRFRDAHKLLIELTHDSQPEEKKP